LPAIVVAVAIDKSGSRLRRGLGGRGIAGVHGDGQCGSYSSRPREVGG
jgi:hypothetical protein